MADGKATSVVVDGESIEVDAVICAVPGTKVPDLVPDLPAATRRALGTVSYSTGCRVVIGLDHSPLPPGWHGALYPGARRHAAAAEPVRVPAGVRSTGQEPPRPAHRGGMPRRSSSRSTTRRSSAGCWAPHGGTHLRGLLSPVTTRACSTVCTAGRRRCAWGEPGMLAAAAQIPGQLVESIENLFLAGDYMRVPSVNGALSSGGRAPQSGSQTCWRLAPGRQGASSGRARTLRAAQGSSREAGWRRGTRGGVAVAKQESTPSPEAAEWPIPLNDDGTPVLLSGGNPQVPKGDGDAPVQAYIAAMPGWKSDLGRRLDELIERTVPGRAEGGCGGTRRSTASRAWAWFLSTHVFARHLKVTFFQGGSLEPMPAALGQGSERALGQHPRGRVRRGADGGVDPPGRRPCPGWDGFR